jgi:acetolactate synthase-1/2/3 large subunit
LPVAVLIFNNANLGLVRQQQELFYGERYSASAFASVPDFAAVARAFGVRGVKIDPSGDPMTQLAEALAQPGPCVIDIPIHDTTNVYPMVPPGAANRDMLTEKQKRWSPISERASSAPEKLLTKPARETANV